MFDLNLAVYRNIKSELDTKLDYSIQLGYLRIKGLLSNYRYPFLIFNDCKAISPIPQNKEIYEKIISDYERSKDLNLNLIYQKILTRVNTINFLTKSPVNYCVILEFQGVFHSQ